MYSLADYGNMIADDERMRAYVAALERVVKPGSAVLDLGAGTGIFSLHACRLGARRVYAIEPNPAIRLLPELARRNGFADRIEVFSKKSSDVTLPEQVDVIVSDLRGASPLFAGHLRIIRDARDRFLRAGGALLPQRDTMMACLVSAPDLYKNLVGPWQAQGFDLQPCIDEVLSSTFADRREPLLPKHCVSELGEWASIDYSTLEDDRVEGSCVLRCDRDVVVHGIGTWFRSNLWDDVGFENAPGSNLVYRRLFLPWPEPTWLKAGTAVKFHINALPASDDYLFAWTTQVAGGPHFKQSNFLGVQAGVWGQHGAKLGHHGGSLFPSASGKP